MPAMRPRSAHSFVAACFVLTLAACLPSTPYVYGTTTPEPQPTPAPPPPPPRVAPMEIAVVRSDNGRLLLQTNRYAYVALFEIVPERGVALLYPGSVRQVNSQLLGLSWVQVYWTIPTVDRDRRYSSANNGPERYVYAIGSDRPLNITDASYDANYLRRMLGPTAYQASNPYATVRALSRWFVPSMTDEHWGESLYPVPSSYSRGYPAERVARVYCPDGSVFEVREDMANRTWCPPNRRGRGGDASGVQQSGGPTQMPQGRLADTPDSVVNYGGQHVTRGSFDQRGTSSVYRVPVQPPNDPPRQTDPKGTTDPRRTDPRSTPDPKGTTDPRGGMTDPRGATDPANPPGGRQHDDNGRRAHGDPANADPRGRGNGRGNGGGRETPADTMQHAKPGQNGQGAQNGQGQNGQNGQGGQNSRPDTTSKANPGKPAETPITGNPGVDSSGKGQEHGKAGEHGQANGQSKEQPKPDSKQEAVNRLLRRAGVKAPPGQVETKPDSTSTPPAPAKP